jgi:hypothetical protein
MHKVAMISMWKIDVMNSFWVELFVTLRIQGEVFELYPSVLKFLKLVGSTYGWLIFMGVRVYALDLVIITQFLGNLYFILFFASMKCENIFW